MGTSQQRHWKLIRDLPKILQLPLDRIGGPLTQPPASGELDGRDVANVDAHLRWDDGHEERCRARVRGWTPTAVLVWAQTSRGQYVAWLDPADVCARRP